MIKINEIERCLWYMHAKGDIYRKRRGNRNLNQSNQTRAQEIETNPAPLSTLRVRIEYAKTANMTDRNSRGKKKKKNQGLTNVKGIIIVNQSFQGGNCLPPVALVLHGLDDLGETGNVGASDERR